MNSPRSLQLHRSVSTFISTSSLAHFKSRLNISRLQWIYITDFPLIVEFMEYYWFLRGIFLHFPQQFCRATFNGNLKYPHVFILSDSLVLNIYQCVIFLDYTCQRSSFYSNTIVWWFPGWGLWSHKEATGTARWSTKLAWFKTSEFPPTYQICSAAQTSLLSSQLMAVRDQLTNSARLITRTPSSYIAS